MSDLLLLTCLSACLSPDTVCYDSLQLLVRYSPRLAVNAEEVIEACKEHPHKKHSIRATGSGTGYHQTWRRDEDAQLAPKYTLPKVGIPSKAAYQLLHDQTALDGNPLLNLAS